MSKSSRRKKSSPEEPLPVRESESETTEVGEVAGEAPAFDSEPDAEVAGISGADSSSEESADSPDDSTENGGLPESVPGEALAGEVPQGEVPSLPLVLEAILFASQKAVTPKELAAHLRNAASAEPTSVAAAYARIRETDVAEALVDLQADVAAAGRAYQVRETATGWILSSGPGFAPWLRALYPEAKPTRLSPSALETLAIIAYRQPITRADMEAVRGVSVDGVMQTLLDRGLVRIAGRAEVAGRPLLYATTQFFLDHFGLRHLDELPNASELRTIPLPQATPEEVPEATPETSADARENSGEGELPAANEGEATAPETVEITEILEVRESVVFEEVVTEAGLDAVVDEPSPEEGIPGHGEEPVA